MENTGQAQNKPADCMKLYRNVTPIHIHSRIASGFRQKYIIMQQTKTADVGHQRYVYQHIDMKLIATVDEMNQ